MDGSSTIFQTTFPNKTVTMVNMLQVPLGFIGQINDYIIDYNTSSIFTWAINQTPTVYLMVIGY